MTKDKRNVLSDFSSWKDVFSKPWYVITALVIALVFYSINVFILNYQPILNSFSSGIFMGISEFIGVFFSSAVFIMRDSFISLLAISVLLGILFSLIIYKTRMLKEASGKTGFFMTLGIFLGILAPGCAACGIGLLSVFGIGAATLSFLPFKGLEVSFLSIIILGFSVVKVTKDIKKGIVCEIQPVKGG